MAVLPALTSAWGWYVTLPLLLVGVLLAALVLPSSLGMIRRVALGGVLYQSGLIVLATLAAPTGWAFHPRLAATILLAVLAVAVALRGTQALGPFALPGDLAALLLGGLAFGVLAVPALGTPAEVADRLSAGFDNANHLNLTRSVQSVQRFVFAEPPAGLNPGSEHYPQGLALTSGYTSWLVRGGDTPPSTAAFLRDQALAWSGMFATIVVFGVLLIGDIVRRRVPSVKVRSTLRAPAALFSFFALAGTPVLLLGFGFQSQILATAAVIALVWVLTVPELHPHPRCASLAACLFTMVVGHSFYLFLPVAAGLTLDTLFRRRAEIGRTAVALNLGVLALASYPALNGPALTQVAVPGVVFRVPWLQLGAIALAAIASFTLGAGPRWRSTRALPVLRATGASVAVSAAVGAQQMLLSGQLTYYFWKSVYLLAILLFVLAASGIAMLWVGARRATAGALMALLAIAWLQTAGLTRAVAFGTIGGHLNQALVEYGVGRFPAGLPADVDLVAFDACDRSATVQTSWWLAGLLLDWSPERMALHAEDAGGRYTHERLTAYAVAHPEREVVVLSESDCVPSDLPETSWPANLTLVRL